MPIHGQATRFEGPLHTLEPGSPPWIRARCSQLATAWQAESRNYTHVFEIIEDLLSQRAPETYPEEKPWGDVDAMCADVLGCPLQEIRDRADRDLRRVKAARAEPRGRNGGVRSGAGRRRASGAPHQSNHDNTDYGQRGTGSDYLLSRMTRDAETQPAALEALNAVRAGELTPNAAAVRLGYRKAQTALRQALAGVRRISSPDELRQVADAVASRLLVLQGIDPTTGECR